MTVNGSEELAATIRLLTDQVQDKFGLSVLDTVLDPMLLEANGLTQLMEDVEGGLHQVDSVLEEARSITGTQL